MGDTQIYCGVESSEVLVTSTCSRTSSPEILMKLKVVPRNLHFLKKDSDTGGLYTTL